ncbi:MAG: uncharacterized protein JWM33_3140 [Caulobacteraceae bacterium]|nr:uncharacterized protein [Caulobacteraceae bacterium]
MADAITKAISIRDRHTEASLNASWVETFATIRCLEIISEASRRFTPELRERHPGLPWRQIMTAGNHYRHGYDALDPAVIWSTLNQLEALLDVTRVELRRLDR